MPKEGNPDHYALLFVDDELEFLSAIQEFFADLGYEVYIAHNGQDVLLKVKKFRPNAVFLDIFMPHMDGTETLRLIREIDEGIQVVVVSGYASAELAKDLLQQGACDFFQKPVDLMKLLATIKHLQTLSKPSEASKPVST